MCITCFHILIRGLIQTLNTEFKSISHFDQIYFDQIYWKGSGAYIENELISVQRNETGIEQLFKRRFQPSMYGTEYPSKILQSENIISTQYLNMASTSVVYFQGRKISYAHALYLMDACL